MKNILLTLMVFGSFGAFAETAAEDIHLLCKRSVDYKSSDWKKLKNIREDLNILTPSKSLAFQLNKDTGEMDRVQSKFSLKQIRLFGSYDINRETLQIHRTKNGKVMGSCELLSIEKFISLKSQYIELQTKKNKI